MVIWSLQILHPEPACLAEGYEKNAAIAWQTIALNTNKPAGVDRNRPGRRALGNECTDSCYPTDSRVSQMNRSHKTTLMDIQLFLKP